MQERQQARIAAPPAHVQLKVQTLELLRQHSCGQAFDPFVEVADENTWAGKMLMQLFGGQQTPYLVSALEKTGSHVNIKNVQRAERSFQIGANAPAPFSPLP